MPAIALLLIAIAGCSSHGPDPSTGAKSTSAPEGLVVVPVQRLELQRTARATGTIFGDEQTTIAAKVAGRVLKVHVDLGDKAEPGQELITIDPTDYVLEREEREMAFKQSLAKLGLTELPSEDLDLAKLPTIERARLEAENAHNRYERGKQLADRDPPLISEQDFADLHTASEVADSNLHVAELDAQAGLAESRTLDAQRRIAEQRVLDTVHRAPVDSANADRHYVVARRMVSVGDFVQIGTPLVYLIDTNPIKLRATVPERLANAIHVREPVTLRVEGETQAFTGTVSRISPAVDEHSRTNMIEITADNNDQRLRPGAFATADIDIGKESVLAIPQDAVSSFAGVSRVFVVRDGKIESARVETGVTDGDLIEVRQGLTGDESVVRNPPANLVAGMLMPSPEALSAGKTGK